MDEAHICPYCLGDSVHMVSADQWRWQVVCRLCGLAAPQCTSKEGALKNWNNIAMVAPYGSPWQNSVDLNRLFQTMSRKTADLLERMEKATCGLEQDITKMEKLLKENRHE